MSTFEIPTSLAGTSTTICISKELISSPSWSLRITKKVTSLGFGDWDLGLGRTCMNLSSRQRFVVSTHAKHRADEKLPPKPPKPFKSWHQKEKFMDPPYALEHKQRSPSTWTPRYWRSLNFSFASGWYAKTPRMSFSASLAFKMHGEIENISPLKLNSATWTSKKKLHPFLANLWPHLDGSVIYQVLVLDSRIFWTFSRFQWSKDWFFQFSTFTPLTINIEPQKLKVWKMIGSFSSRWFSGSFPAKVSGPKGRGGFAWPCRSEIISDCNSWRGVATSYAHPLTLSQVACFLWKVRCSLKVLRKKINKSTKEWKLFSKFTGEILKYIYISIYLSKNPSSTIRSWATKCHISAKSTFREVGQLATWQTCHFTVAATPGCSWSFFLPTALGRCERKSPCHSPRSSNQALNKSAVKDGEVRGSKVPSE